MPLLKSALFSVQFKLFNLGQLLLDDESHFLVLFLQSPQPRMECASSWLLVL